MEDFPTSDFQPPDLGIAWGDLASHVGKALRGRVSEPLEVGTPQPLAEEDIILGADLRGKQKLPTSTAPEILRLRSRHHLIAQMLAAGVKPTVVAFKTGYSISRISILQADPMFKELLANYQGLQENINFDVKERLRLLSIDAIDALQQRLDEKPDDFESEELRKLAEMTLDRTGHGKSAIVQHTYGLDLETAELIKANRPEVRTANLLEGDILELENLGGQNGHTLAEPDQFDLFGTKKPQDESPGGTEDGSLFGPETFDDPEGEVELSAEERAALSTAVHAVYPETGNVVKFISRGPLGSDRGET